MSSPNGNGHLSRLCFVPGCTTGKQRVKKTGMLRGKINKSLFQAKSKAQLEMWRKVIPPREREFEKNDVVCELHFTEKDIMRYYETKLSDGHIHKFERGYPLLKKDAIPIFVTKDPKSMEWTVRENPKDENPVLTSNPEFDRHKGTSVEEGVEDLSSLFEQYVAGSPSVKTSDNATNLNSLKEQLKSIILPGHNWGTAEVGKNVIFACMGSNFLPEKTIVLLEDLTIKVMLHGEEVSMEAHKSVKDLNDLINIIRFIDKLQL